MKTKIKLLMIALMLPLIVNAGAGDNVALHKPYTLYPSPDMTTPGWGEGGPTEPGDAADLTDGKHSPAGPPEYVFWTSKSSVGWTAALPLILIDLGKVYPIDAVTYNACSSKAHGRPPFPSMLRLWVSEDGKSYFKAGEIKKEDEGISEPILSGSEPSLIHKFVFKNLGTKGRYVLLSALALDQSRGVVCDEIEVIEGKHNVSDVTLKGEPVIIAGLAAFRGEQIKEQVPASFGAGLKDAITISTEIVSPHTPWAKPYYKGGIDALIFVPHSYERDIVELAERMDLNFTGVQTSEDTSIFGKEKDFIPGDVLVSLSKEALARKGLNLIIIGRIEWQAIPEDIRGSILERVKEGAGLVYIKLNGFPALTSGDIKEEKISDKEGFIWRGIPFMFLPPFAKYGTNAAVAEKVIALSQFGKGRIVKLSYNPFGLIPAATPTGSFAYCDYYASFLIKAMLWAVNKEPDVLINDMSVKDNVANLEIKSGKNINATVRFTVRDEECNVELEKEKEISLKEGITPVSLDIPRQKDGLHLVDVVIKEGDKHLNWASAFFKVDSDLKIEKITLEKDYYRQGETVRGKVVLNKIPEQELDLKVGLRDNYKRLLKQTALKTTDKENEFSFPIDYALSILLYVKAEISEDGLLLYESTQDFAVEQNREINDLMVVNFSGSDADSLGIIDGRWDYSRFINNLTFQSLNERYFVDANTTMPPKHGSEEADKIARYFARYNMGYIPYLIHISLHQTSPRVDDPLVRKPCLNDPAYREELTKTLTEQVKFAKKYSPPAYNLGDENCLYTPEDTPQPRDYCFSPYCREDFRKYLKEQYGSLENLNKEWGTDFKDWKEVKALTLEEARKKNCYPAWIDHRLHMESVFADIHGFCRDVIRSVDKDAKVGFEGPLSMNSFVGYDWAKLMDVMDFCILYSLWIDNLQERDLYREYVRSFAGKGSLTSSGWHGGYGHKNDEDFFRYQEWFNIFRGYNISGIYYAAFHTGGRGNQLLKGDLSPYNCLRWMTEELKPIKEGIGALILNASKENDGIAIHYSPPSYHAGTISGEGNVFTARRDFASLLSDIGLQYNFISIKEVETGGLKNYKVLILPFSSCLSGKEAEKIKEFVKNGGLLIADCQAGVMDGHGKLLKQGSLDEVFGLKRKGGCTLATQKTNIKVWPGAAVDPEIVLAGGTALETANDAPLVIVNKYGQGNAVYLNFAMNRYLTVSFIGKAEPMRGLMEGLLKDYRGVESRVKVVTAEGKRTDRCEVNCFKNGNAEYVGLLKTSKGKESVRLTFPYKAHVYDVRTKEYFGFTDSIPATIEFARAKLYALLPYEVISLALDLKERYAKGDIIKFGIGINSANKNGPFAPHVFRLELYDPDGSLCRPYCRNLRVTGGSYGGKLPLALNEKEGAWKMLVKDVVSGKAAEKTFQVK